MTYCNKALRLQRRTAEIQDQRAQERIRRRSWMVAVLQRSADDTLHQHEIAIDPDSINLD